MLRDPAWMEKTHPSTEFLAFAKLLIMKHRGVKLHEKTLAAGMFH